MRWRACKDVRLKLGIPVLLALGGGLCGCSGPLLVFRAQPKPVAAAEEPAVTGSIARRPASFGDDLAEEDWRRAKAALSVALDPQGNGRPVKWDNPETGLYGSVNPTGLPYVADDLICRNFLASVVAPGRSRFVRGTGCKPSGGEWTLRRVRSAAAPAKPTQ
ncbi:RT0821/Lpp0805 family surface protein [Methylobacterium sp. NEAU 140]|uniref:RT0821/Lpp0805 family surface protein n=1 Tax=Methylobacterium sp. NEAU 140 TaxID=3064945 RepID=UPI0027366FB1|nr:RT0821/Lpp0805 family surface protein [Methylobacterium sp. NEAU 140]MDP4022701.1 RT0821/Lpp0805 family surface protein [Methylobacterium sp. NEAU 140]